MNEKFEDTLRDDNVFMTYAMGILTLSKSIQVIQKRGADEKAVSFLITGLEALVKQLEENARRVENREFVENFLKEVRKA